MAAKKFFIARRTQEYFVQLNWWSPLFRSYATSSFVQHLRFTGKICQGLLQSDLNETPINFLQEEPPTKFGKHIRG